MCRVFSTHAALPSLLGLDLKSGEIELMRGDPISTSYEPQKHSAEYLHTKFWPLLCNLTSGELPLRDNEPMAS